MRLTLNLCITFEFLFAGESRMLPYVNVRFFTPGGPTICNDHRLPIFHM